MLATWLSRLNVKTRIVDKRSTKIFTVSPCHPTSRKRELIRTRDRVKQMDCSPGRSRCCRALGSQTRSCAKPTF